MVWFGLDWVGEMVIIGEVWDYMLMYVWGYVVQCGQVDFFGLYYFVLGGFDGLYCIGQQGMLFWGEVGHFFYVCMVDYLVEVWIIGFIDQYYVKCVMLLQYFVIIVGVQLVSGNYGGIYGLYQDMFDVVIVGVFDVFWYLVFVQQVMCYFYYDVVGGGVGIFVVV